MEATSWVLFVKSSHFKALSPSTLHTECSHGGRFEEFETKVLRVAKSSSKGEVIEEPSVGEGIEEALRIGDKERGAVVIVCGSLFACGDGRKWMKRYVTFPE